MDNFIYIGYRIDCRVNDSAEDIDKFWDLEKAGFSICALPGKDWMFWTHIKCHKMNSEYIISVFPMRGEFAGDYRCPVNQSEIYKSLFEDSIDTPDTFMHDAAKVINTVLYRKLREMFSVRVAWGIFLGLG